MEDRDHVLGELPGDDGAASLGGGVGSDERIKMALRWDLDVKPPKAEGESETGTMGDTTWTWARTTS